MRNEKPPFKAVLAVAALLLTFGCRRPAPGGAPGPAPPAPPGAALQALPQERRLRNLRPLTFGGENAEAYFSFDGKRLVFQSTRDGRLCDQIYTMDLRGGDLRRVSNGEGRTTCSYFYPDGGRILFSSTHLAASDCPPPPDRSRGYTWAVYPSYDLFTAAADGTDLRRLTDAPGYDAEATISPRGDRIVFTSARDGDLDLYSMDLGGSDVRRLTKEKGYDGGAFFSPDGKEIVYRAHHPKDPAEIKEYEELLAKGLVRPSRMEIFVMDAGGSNVRQVTKNGAANFCPFFHPDGERILFASNRLDPKGRNFDLFLIRKDGTEEERVTFHESFDGFPMFSPDGRLLAFASNRGAREKGETNIFLAEWVE